MTKWKVEIKLIDILQDTEVHITYEDQQKINKFARFNARLHDFKEELEEKKVCIRKTNRALCW